MKRIIPGWGGEERLKMLRELGAWMAERGRDGSMFMANRIVNNLWLLLEEGAKDNPDLWEAAFDGRIELRIENDRIRWAVKE